MNSIRTLRQLLLAAFLTGGLTCSFGQSIILEESTTANYWGYMNQMNSVQASLRTGKVNLNLELSGSYVLSDTLLNRLSEKFNRFVPTTFFSDGAFVIDSDTKPTRKGQYTKYTYSSIERGDIKYLVELIVTFEVNMQGEGVKFPKVSKIEVNSPRLVKMDNDKIVKEYNDRKAEADKLPPPPRN
jgi:hypothetical protein